MAIKRLTLLSATEVADGPFRSLLEVEKYLGAVKENLTELESLINQYQTLFARAEQATIEFTINRDSKEPTKKGGAKIGLDKIKVPKLDTLRKNFSIIEDLSDQVDMLNNLYNTVSVNFKGTRGANDTLSNIKAMKKSAEVKMQAALKFLSTVGSKYIPTEFKSMVESTIGFISPNLTFRKHETFIYAYETAQEHLSFSVYIKLYGLEDDTGNQFPEFYIVFTCVLKPSNDKNKVDAFYYVTAMPDFQPPGKYILGKAIETPAKAASALGLMLEMENVSTAIGVLPHNLDPQKLKKSKFSVGSRVADIQVDPDTITFEFLKGVTESEAQSLAVTLYRELQAMVSIKKAKLKARIFKDIDRFVVRFTITNMAKESQISITDIDFLKEHFPQLDDQKIRQVVKVINSD